MQMERLAMRGECNSLVLPVRHEQIPKEYRAENLSLIRVDETLTAFVELRRAMRESAVSLVL